MSVLRHCLGGVFEVALAGGGSGEEERSWQWRACRSVVGLAAAQRPNFGVVGAGGGRRACCGVGRAAAAQHPHPHGGIVGAGGAEVAVREGSGYGSGEHAWALSGWGWHNACMAALLGSEGGSRSAVVLVGRCLGISGRVG